jgi:hypothetical protein
LPTELTALNAILAEQITISGLPLSWTGKSSLNVPPYAQW